MEEIFYVYKIDAAHIHTMPEHQVVTLPPLPQNSKREGLAKILSTVLTLIVVF